MVDHSLPNTKKMARFKNECGGLSSRTLPAPLWEDLKMPKKAKPLLLNCLVDRSGVRRRSVFLSEKEGRRKRRRRRTGI